MRTFMTAARIASTQLRPAQFRFAPAAVRSVPAAFRAFSAGPEPLTVQQIEDRILKLLKDFDKVDGSKLSLDAHFAKDLGLDSLDQVEITMALEDEFSIELPDRDAEEIMTPRQAVEKVFANKSAI